MLLLNKVRHIMMDRQTDNSQPFIKGSLNRGARRQELTKIMQENEVRTTPRVWQLCASDVHLCAPTCLLLMHFACAPATTEQ